jgi:hypothetical protein
MEPVLDNVMSLDEEEIRSCFNSYPDGWDIKDHHINKVTEFVLERRDHLADVLRNNLV